MSNEGKGFYSLLIASFLLIPVQGDTNPAAERVVR
jgi:hypothetical protein